MNRAVRPVAREAVRRPRGTAPRPSPGAARPDASPAPVIGPPAGLAGAAVSRETSRASGPPAVRDVSDKGGPAVAAAAPHALPYHPVSAEETS
ncbi:precorrin-8X methylmutase [Streptomyces naphthomycinicus]|uniref:precorrin-8X methylmutase n=1 Tax=Streptomyces naphthomycinicus TaxID=2872625 RepID=UPI001CEDA709|nr:precorrin-8X methylmutase [Streptomyces sp. TML10]